MKNTGMIRRVDELGRIVIPKEIRNKLNIEIKDELEIYVEKGRIVLEKVEDFCILCGRTLELIDYNENKICEKCINDLIKKSK